MNGEEVFVGIGGNLSHPVIGPPSRVMTMALQALSEVGILVRQRSRWYQSAPLPPSAQPDYLNGVLQVATALDPWTLLQVLHTVEMRFGRVRGEANAARILDLDLLAYGRLIKNDANLMLPHPRLHLRAFVLKPLLEIAPDWRHPVLDRSVAELLGSLPVEQTAELLATAN